MLSEVAVHRIHFLLGYKLMCTSVSLSYLTLVCQNMHKSKPQRNVSSQLFILNYRFNFFNSVTISNILEHITGFLLVSLVPVLLMLAFCNCNPFQQNSVQTWDYFSNMENRILQTCGLDRLTFHDRNSQLMHNIFLSEQCKCSLLKAS